MLSRKCASYRSDEQGLTLIELMVTIVLIGIVSTIFYTVFNTNIKNYLRLQKDASSFTQLGTQSARVSNVVRGTTDILNASDNQLTIYAYFYPADTYVSLLRYYVATSAGQTQLMADLTPMSSNPPIGTPLVAQKRSFVVIDNLYIPIGTSLFEYKGANDIALNQPIVDQKAIKAIQVNLATQAPEGTQKMSIKVSLRNRKTNL
jgi:prepilin-type N-terminal cleavage/methylation domain-containing protein